VRLETCTHQPNGKRIRRKIKGKKSKKEQTNEREKFRGVPKPEGKDCDVTKEEKRHKDGIIGSVYGRDNGTGWKKRQLTKKGRRKITAQHIDPE